MARWRTITARYSGVCKRCGGTITPGQSIRYGGGSLTYHLKSQCSVTQNSLGEPASDVTESRKTPFRTCAEGGRCEDYPCCGCDGLHGRELYQPSEPYEGY